MTKKFEGKFKVGDRVNAFDPHAAYNWHEGQDLVVLYMDEDEGYGVGIVGNDPDKHHDGEHGWLWYYPHEVWAIGN